TSAPCDQLGNGSQFNGFKIACNTDAPGSDIGTVSATSFADCIGRCTAFVGCSSFSFVGGNGAGTCYLKNRYVPSASNPSNADSGFISDPSQASRTQTPSAPASAVTSFFSSAAALTTLPVVLLAPTNVAASCQQLGNGSQAGQYTNRCGTDAIGGDFMNIQADSFAGCGPLCDAQPQCIGYAYVGGNGPGTCYLKSTQEPASTNSNVDIAFKPAA
ncbi:hypothetical protein DOTSEDRAFT_106389, partial [Dothistroma septosporum NZE10]